MPLYTSALTLHLKRQEFFSQMLALIFELDNLLVRVQVFHRMQSLTFGIEVPPEHAHINSSSLLLGCLSSFHFQPAVHAVSVRETWLLFVRRRPPVDI